MLSSIHPLGERGRNNKWPITVVYFIVGGALGGAVMGLAAGLVGALGLSWWSPTSATLQLTIGAILLGTLVVEFLGLPVPSVHRQVNEDWLTMYRSWVYAGGFGFQLGLGFVTIVTTFATYATIALAVLSRDLAVGAAIGASFGFVRSLPILTVSRVISGETLRTYHRRMQRLASPAEWLVRTTVVAAGLVLVGGSL